MNKRFIFSTLILLSLILTAAILIPQDKTTIYLIGDSTCADKPLDDNPERGWGQLFPNFFNDDIVIENHAKNGRSTKSFRIEGLWKNVYNKLKPGDYVFIQFGHNDQKINDTTRYAAPHTDYKKNLERYVAETREKDAIPVLLTPVNRRKYDDNGNFVDQHGDYPDVVREVAKQLDVPLIDVHKKSLKIFSDLGAEGTEKLFLFGVPPDTYKSLPKGHGDNTHFTHDGAILVSKMVVEGMKELNLPIVSYLKDKVDFSDEAKGKVVALDYYFNHEMKKNRDGKEIQFHYIWVDKDNSGYFRLGNIIESMDATLYEIKTAPTLDELKNVSLYIIVDPDTPQETEKPNYIDSESIDQIVNWVNGGGILVLMANDKGNCEFEHLNNLSEKFGIHFNEDSRNRVTGTNFDIGKFDTFPDHPIFNGVKQIYLKEISTLKLNGNAKPIFTDNGDVIMAGSESGKGFVFAVGDPWIYNEYIDNRKLPIEFENIKAAKNLFAWLLSKGQVVKKSLME